MTPVPSQTNFVFADIGRDARAFAAQMAAKGVQIKGNVADYPTYIRVSMGKTEDLKVFDRVFNECIHLAAQIKAHIKESALRENEVLNRHLTLQKISYNEKIKSLSQ